MDQKEFYNKYAETYSKQVMNPESLYVANERTFGKWKKLFKGKKILDAGAGDGISYTYIGDEFQELVLLDISKELLKIAKKRIKDKRIKFVVGDLNKKILFPDNYFDVIIVNSALHHTNIPVSLKQLRRVAKPNCYLLIIEPLITPINSFAEVWSKIIPFSSFFFNFIEAQYKQMIKKKPVSNEKTYSSEHPLDYEVTFEELTDLLNQNGFEWMDYKTSWFRIIPFLPTRNTYSWYKFNFLLSDFFENFRALKNKGKFVHGIAICRKRASKTGVKKS